MTDSIEHCSKVVHRSWPYWMPFGALSGAESETWTATHWQRWRHRAASNRLTAAVEVIVPYRIHLPFRKATDCRTPCKTHADRQDR